MDLTPDEAENLVRGLAVLLRAASPHGDLYMAASLDDVDLAVLRTIQIRANQEF